MKSLLLLILLIFLTGFIIETPESRAEDERRAKEWCEQVLSEYDPGALLDFLESMIQMHPAVDGVNLTASEVANEWIIDDWVLRAGDWVFQNHIVAPNKFNLSWVYETNFDADGAGPFKEIVFHCERIEKDKFALLSASAQEDEIILIIP